MQLLYGTATGLGYRGPPSGLYDPATNIALGTRYLAQLRDAYGDFKRVISAYNSGGPDNYKTNPQVAAHVAKVLAALPAVSTGLLLGLGLVLYFWRKKGS